MIATGFKFIDELNCLNSGDLLAKRFFLYSACCGYDF